MRATWLADVDVGSIFVWSIALVILLFGGFIAVSYIRKWANSDDAPSAGTGFSMGDLRQMHKSGQMSDEEFAKAKAALLGSMGPVGGPPATETAQNRPKA